MNDVQKTVALGKLWLNTKKLSWKVFLKLDLSIFWNTVDSVQIEISAIVNFERGDKGLIAQMREVDWSIWNVVKSMHAKVFDVSDAVISNNLESSVDLTINWVIDLNINKKRTVPMVENSQLLISLIRIGIKHRHVGVTDGDISKHSGSWIFKSFPIIVPQNASIAVICALNKIVLHRVGSWCAKMVNTWFVYNSVIVQWIICCEVIEFVWVVIVHEINVDF